MSENTTHFHINEDDTINGISNMSIAQSEGKATDTMLADLNFTFTGPPGGPGAFYDIH